MFNGLDDNVKQGGLTFGLEMLPQQILRSVIIVT